MRSFFILIEQYRYRFLLAILLAAIILQPLFHEAKIGQAILVLAYCAILVGGIYATNPKPRLMTLCSTLAIALVGLSWYALASGSSQTSVVLVMVTVVLGVFAASRTLFTLVAAPGADADAMAGAIFGYFLLAVVWALLYRAQELWIPGAFSLAADDSAFTELMYFSLVTITTLGYGDVLPIAPVTRITAGLESAMGTLYTAILIARVVGALGERKD
ncbi:MAG: potassium channel family protein [Alphaproteobacteria bacterium]